MLYNFNIYVKSADYYILCIQFMLYGIMCIYVESIDINAMCHPFLNHIFMLCSIYILNLMHL